MRIKDKLEELHRRMIAEIQDYAIILLDIDGTILTWNKGVEQIKGYKEHEIIDRTSEYSICQRTGRQNCLKASLTSL